jgi:two-component system phosphate regulon response regulator OmpR
MGTPSAVCRLAVRLLVDPAKPFDPRELKARLKSVLRRYQRSTQPATTLTQTSLESTSDNRRIPVGNCLLDLDSRQLFDTGGTELQLTRMEFDLLEVLVQRPRRPLSRDQLLNLTQNRDWDPYDRSIDIRVARLRRKIEADPENPQCIRTLRGVGYMYVPAQP